MAAKSVGTKVFDFVKISESLPSSLRAQLNGLRSQYQAVHSKLSATSEEPPAIDFAKYENSINYPGYVDSIKKEYASAKYQYPADTNSSAIDASEKAALAEAQKMIEDSKVRVAALEAELSALHAERPLQEITIDEYLADKPELKKEIEEEIKNHNYM